MRRAAAISGGLVGSGLLTLGYAGVIERNLFTLRRFEVAVLPPGSPSLRILQLADLHITPQQRRKVEWVRSLATLEPDLVISTGDHLGGDEAAFENSLRAHEPFLHLPGAFVWGNNDHWAPVPKSPTRYFRRTTVHRRGRYRRLRSWCTSDRDSGGSSVRVWPAIGSASTPAALRARTGSPCRPR